MVILDTLLEITLYTSIVVIVTLLLKKLFSRRMSPWLHYAVWFVLIVRLMLPVTIESGFHVFTAPSQAQTQAAAVPQASVPAASADSIVNDNASAQPEPIKAYDSHLNTVSPVSASALPTAKPLSAYDILLIVWLSGTGISLIYIAVLYGTLRQRVRKNAALPSARLITLFNDVKAEMNIKARLRLVCQYEYGTPALLLPRTVLMPVDTLIAMDDEQIRFALRHELTHYRRGDHITCLLISLLNAVYWFNPFVWLAFRQMRADMEIACDSKVVQALDVPQKSRYASLIVGLFAQTERRQLVLGMAQGSAKKIAEQCVRGIFKEAKSHASVKFISAFAVVLLLVTCFTTACQPTPETPPVNNKNTSVVEEVVQANAEENEQELKKDKEVIAEQIKKVNGHMVWDIKPNDYVTINVDADIVAPEFDQLPIVRIKPNNLSQKQFETLISYLSDGAPLYYMEQGFNYTQEEVATILPTLQQKLENKDLPPYIKDHIQYRIDDIKEQMGSAKSKAEDKPYNGTLMTTDNNKYYSTITQLKCYLDKNVAATMSLWQSFNETTSQIVFENANYFDVFNTYEPYEGTDASGIKMTYEQAKAEAEEFVRKIDGEDSNLLVYDASIGYQIGTFSNYTKETSPQAYAFTFARCYNGIVVKRVGYLWGTDENIDYGKQVSPESLMVMINDDGINNVYWANHTEYIEDVASDSPLLDFDSIQKLFEEHCSQKFAWVPRNDALPPNQHVTLTVKKIELNMMPIPEKDNLENYITVPVWDFIADMTYDKEVYAQDGYPAEGEKNVSIVTINAINGTIINREQGY